jgi:hypothetical protein
MKWPEQFLTAIPVGADLMRFDWGHIREAYKLFGEDPNGEKDLSGDALCTLLASAPIPGEAPDLTAEAEAFLDTYAVREPVLVGAGR